MYAVFRSAWRTWLGRPVVRRPQRWEVEANEFASLILMPPPLWRKATASYRHPDLSHIATLRRTFKVSADAAARTYATYHDEVVGVAVVKDGALLRAYRNPTKFSFLAVSKGEPIPRASIIIVHRKSLDTLQRLHPARLRHVQAAILGLPLVEGRRPDAVLAAQLRHRQARFLLTQDPNDLLFREP